MTTRRILVVEDEETILELMRIELEDQGYAVTVACDGTEAQARLEEGIGELDLVILDLNVPRVSGWDLLEGIRALRSDLPILVSTGRFEPRLEELQAVGLVAGILRKPFTLSDFAAVVSGLLAD